MKSLNSYVSKISTPCLSKDSHYKKSFGAWGESFLDEFMSSQRWIPYRKNLKMRHGEIDRVYCSTQSSVGYVEKNFCIAEIKTIYCKNKKKFFSFFTEIGLSALIKQNQIRNLYKYAEYLNARENRTAKSIKIFIRFFIVLKIYENYEKEYFFQSQNTYKVCSQTKNELILSFRPEPR